MPPYPWQNSLWQSFVDLVQKDTLPHALLLSSSEGQGAEKLVSAMAAFLLCQSPMDGLVCGRCKACQLLAAGTHPDKFELEPEQRGKAIKVDLVRQLIDFVAKTAQQGGRKVVVIRPAEAMNINAANSLLKCLEEPAGDTVLILLSHAIGQLMPTVRSRCSKMTLPSPETSVAVAWLQEQGIDNAELLLSQAGLAPVKVLEWWQSENFQLREQMFKQWTEFSEGYLQVTVLAAQWAKQDLQEVFDALLAWVDALIREQSGAHSGLVAKAEDWQAYTAATRSVPVLQLFRYRDVILKRKAQGLSSANLNANLLLEELLLDWRALIMAVRKNPSVLAV